MVLDERDAVGSAESNQRGLQQVVSRQFVRDKIVQMQTFRRRVLDMPHVEIEPPAVQEKAAVARRFLVIAIMKIDRPGIGFAEQIIFDLRRPKFGIHVRLVFAEKTTVLGFDSNDSIHSNQITRRMATWLSQKRSPHLHPLSKRGEANRMTQYAGRISLRQRARDEHGLHGRIRKAETQEVFSHGSTRIFARNESGNQAPRNDGSGSRRQMMTAKPSLVERPVRLSLSQWESTEVSDCLRAVSRPMCNLGKRKFFLQRGGRPARRDHAKTKKRREQST